MPTNPTGNKSRPGRNNNHQIKPTGTANAATPTDAMLVADYRRAIEEHGRTSEAASLAFEPIFRRYWPYVYGLAQSRVAPVYAEDLAAETMSTVLERLNGKEVITNLRGLVLHSFGRDYAGMLEKVYQGRKLARAGGATTTTGFGGGLPAGAADLPWEAGCPSDDADGGAKPKVTGAKIYSLNVPAPHNVDGDTGLELLHLIPDNHTESDIEEIAGRRELAAVLRALIAEMPAHYRGPLIYRCLTEIPVKEVGEKLNLTPDQVKHNVARGLKWLAKRMPGGYGDWVPTSPASSSAAAITAA